MSFLPFGRHSALSIPIIPFIASIYLYFVVSLLYIVMLNIFEPFCLYGLRLLHFGEGNKFAQQNYLQCVASDIVDILLMICLTIHAVQEFHTSAEEMRHNLLAIYQKLGKSFDVGDIAARFSYVPIFTLNSS